jgi:hypothetical protein
MRVSMKTPNPRETTSALSEADHDFRRQAALTVSVVKGLRVAVRPRRWRVESLFAGPAEHCPVDRGAPALRCADKDLVRTPR